jgi:hypothetical protein
VRCKCDAKHTIQHWLDDTTRGGRR